jgi:hypothetical protein
MSLVKDLNIKELGVSNSYIRRKEMVTNDTNSSNVAQTIEPEKKKKKTFWGKVGTFMMMGGFMLVIIVVVVLAVVISMLFK